LQDEETLEGSFRLYKIWLPSLWSAEEVYDEWSSCRSDCYGVVV
jgi:hypothetical protein